MVIAEIMDCLVPLRCMGCYVRVDHRKSVIFQRRTHPLRKGGDNYVPKNTLSHSYVGVNDYADINICDNCERLFDQTPWLISGHLPVWVMWNYQGLARVIINTIKEQADRPLLEYLLAKIVFTLRTCLYTVISPHQPIALIPAPTRRKTHDTDIAWQLCKAIIDNNQCSGFMYPIAYLDNRARDSVGLNKSQRWANISQHLYFTADAATIARTLAGHTVIIIDDVMTSGSTIQAVVQGLAACKVHVDAAMILCAR